jgi:hypothetical protein
MPQSPNLSNGGGKLWKFSRQAVPQTETVQQPQLEPVKPQARIAERAPTSEQSANTIPARRHVSPSNARVPSPQYRRDVVDWAPAYFAALEASARKAASAKIAGITLRSVQRRRETDAAFAAEELSAMTVAGDMIEDEITRRAIEGIEEPVFGSGGKGVGTIQVGTIRRFSDTLLLRIAERTETGSWRQKQQMEHSTPGMYATRAERKADLAKMRAEIAHEEAKESGRLQYPEAQ